MGDTVTLDQILTAVISWFGEVGGVSLKLPSGWFGRPYDNLHRLSSAQVSDSGLVLVLDDVQQLSIAGPASIRASPKSLRFVGSKRIEWRWFEYGSNEPHVGVFPRGELEFHFE